MENKELITSTKKKSYYQRRKEKGRELSTLSSLSSSNNSPGVVSTIPAVMEGITLVSSLENDSDITELSQQLLTLVNRCIPKATDAYEQQPKKSNADALNLFISQSRELANDLRSLQNKKAQTDKIIKECLTPGLQQIHEQMLNIPQYIKEMSSEDYEDEIKKFMSLVVRGICEKLKEIL